MGSGGQTQQTNSVTNNTPYAFQGGSGSQGQQMVNDVSRLKFMPYSNYPYVPYYSPGAGWYGGYENIMTGEVNKEIDPQTGAYKRPPFQSMVAAQPAETTQGLNALVNRATRGNPILNAAQGNLSDTLSGKYLTADSNPYLSGMYNAASRQMMQNYNEQTQPQTNAMFNRAGAFGGSAHRLYQAQQSRDLQQGMGDLASQMYGNQYEQERQKQLQAALVGPQIAQSDYYDIQALLSAGDIKRTEEQNKLNELLNYYTGAQQWPYQQQQFQSTLIPPIYGGGGTSTTSQTGMNPYYVNPASKAMGGLSSGIGMGTMLGMATGNPLIGAAGGLAGLLTGLF